MQRLPDRLHAVDFFIYENVHSRYVWIALAMLWRNRDLHYSKGKPLSRLLA